MLVLTALLPLVAFGANTNKVRLARAVAVSVPTYVSAPTVPEATPLVPIDATDIPPASEVQPLSPVVVKEVFALAMAQGLPPETITAVYVAASAEALTEATLVEIAALATAQGIEPEKLEPILALSFAKASFKSRFDMLNPAAFSTMWYIKMKAKAAEEKGENTDALWQRYWKMFESAARHNSYQKKE